MKSVLCLIPLIALGGCVSIALPDSDNTIPADFEEKVASNREYPSFSDAPKTPEMTRSMGQWEMAANELQAIGDGISVPAAAGKAMTDREVMAELSRIRAEINAYQLEDPQSGFDPFAQNQLENPRPKP